MANDSNEPSSQPSSTTFSQNMETKDTSSILSKHIHSGRFMKVICIGAGASGLLFAYKLQRSFENFHLTLYEKNGDIGGTWYENKYPGCACDIPAHVYTWSFEPKADWSKTYAGSSEIFTYFNEFARKYELNQYIKLRHEVVHAVWDDAYGIWKIQVKDLETGAIINDECHIFVNATGVLNKWRLPAIPGIKEFKGTLLHTARWDTNVDLSGKHVALIGNGSSAIQVLPAIHGVVSKITNFIREATWITPTFGGEPQVYTEEEKRQFLNHPKTLTSLRKELESRTNGLFSIFFQDSDEQKQASAEVRKLMQQRLNSNVSLEEKLIPKWGIGCRRMTPGVDYLETLGSDKVNIVFGGIKRITETGCVSNDGQEHTFDALICATGFDVSFRPRFPIIGLRGRSLADEWAEEAKGYWGIAAPNMPNYLIFIGPNSPIGNGPVLSAVEAQADYMMKFINRWQTEHIHSFSPSVEAVEDFITHKDQFMQNTVWNHPCRSWYKSDSVSGKISALWPGSTLHYIEAMAEPRYEDWVIRYSGNRFSFLGDGRSRTESTPGADLAYYIRTFDDSPFLGRAKQKIHTRWPGVGN